MTAKMIPNQVEKIILAKSLEQSDSNVAQLLESRFESYCIDVIRIISLMKVII